MRLGRWKESPRSRGTETVILIPYPSRHRTYELKIFANESNTETSFCVSHFDRRNFVDLRILQLLTERIRKSDWE